MIVNPNCPKCDVEIKFLERLNEDDFDLVTRGKTIYAKEVCAGGCPKCHQRYTWDALYAFSHNEDLDIDESRQYENNY